MVLTHLNCPLPLCFMSRRQFLKDEQLKILKTMSEATNRMDMNMFAKAVNLTPNQTIAQIQELTQEGFLHKVGHGYGLTAKGKNALKMSTQVSEENAFHFYLGVDQPLGFSARSLEEIYRLISQVCSDAIDFHLYRGDFERWLSDVLNDKELAIEIAEFRTEGLKGDELRKALLKAVDAKYGVGELL